MKVETALVVIAMLFSIISLPTVLEISHHTSQTASANRDDGSQALSVD